MTRDSPPATQGLKTPPIEFPEVPGPNGRNTPVGRSPSPQSRAEARDRREIAILQAKKKAWDEQGLCLGCGAERSGKKFCALHLEYFRSFQRERRSKLKAQGKCVQCSLAKPCQCNARVSERKIAAKRRRLSSAKGVKTWIDKKRSIGLCLAYHCRETAVSGSVCLLHGAKDYSKQLIRERGLRYRLRLRASGSCRRCGFKASKTYCLECSELNGAERFERKKRYALAGLCSCGRRPRRGRYTCTKCSEYSASRHRMVVQRRRSVGSCLSCNSPRAPNRSYCQPHLDHGSAAARRRRKLRSGRVFK